VTPIDLLLEDGLVLTMDDSYRVFDPGAVAIHQGLIVGVGQPEDLKRQFEPQARFSCRGRIVLPGLINAHTHAPMTLLRGLADDLRLDVWFLGYMVPVEREFVDPDFVRLGTQLACAEMIRSGVTTFADLYYFEEEVARVTAQAGMRALCSQTVLKFPSPDAGSFEDSLAACREFIVRWKGHPLIVPSVGPHAPYTCTPEILKACSELAVELDVPLHTHLAETALEVENSRRENGMPVIPYVKKQDLLEAKVLAAHCVHIDEGEMRTLLHAGAGVAHNPSSNLKLASGVAPVAKMLETGLNVGIGTDGAASNNDLDMFEETRLAAFLAKGISGVPTAVPARLALTMATRLGARALHMGDITGSLEIGKRADIILVNPSEVHSSPGFHHSPDAVYSRLVYSAHASDVTDVMVNGRWLMHDRQLLTLDQEELLRNAQEVASRIDAFLVQRETSVLSKLIAIGGTTEAESFEVQVKVRIEQPEPVVEKLTCPELTVLRHRHYREYDTYFAFADPDQGRLRYREDEFIDENGEVYNVRSRLTLTGPAREQEFQHTVLLSRSRFLAPATHSLRFYREYFQPEKEIEVHKDRLRWLVRYSGTEFFINLDQVDKPALPGHFLEVKSRTWSRRDAENKAQMIIAILSLLGAGQADATPSEYVELAHTAS
jgi:5-methylthioadenosine/S-adenosylhomocysteine deaminase